jgi:hypothetical protein
MMRVRGQYGRIRTRKQQTSLSFDLDNPSKCKRAFFRETSAWERVEKLGDERERKGGE